MKQPSNVPKKAVNFISESKKQQLSSLVAVKVTTCTKYIFIYIKFLKESKMAQA